MTHPDPAAVLRPLSMLATRLLKETKETADSHNRSQFLITNSLVPALSDFEEPLDVMIKWERSSSETSGDAEDLELFLRGLSQASRSLAAPSILKRAVFWKESDCRPAINAVVERLEEAVPKAKRLASALRVYEAIHPRPDIDKPRDTDDLFFKRAGEVETAYDDLKSSLTALEASRLYALEFLLAWRRYSGSIPKKEIPNIESDVHELV